MNFTTFCHFFFLENIFFPTTHTHDPRPTTFSYTPNLWRDRWSRGWRQTSKLFTSRLKAKLLLSQDRKGRVSKISTISQDGFSHCLFPSPPPHRFLSRPRFSFRAADSLTLRTTKEKTDQKIPQAPQAVLITRVANSLSLFQTLIETTVIYFLPDIWRLFVLSGCSQGDGRYYISTWSFENRVAWNLKSLPGHCRQSSLFRANHLQPLTMGSKWPPGIDRN